MRHPKNSSIPIVVDLDGTLIRGDLLMETAVRFLKARPLKFYLLFFWILKGKAYLKQRLAVETSIDISLLPYNQELLFWLHTQKNDGRKLVLATASDISLAKAVQNHLNLFSLIFASDGKRNLSSHEKSDALVSKFGERGYDYVGNSKDDIAVWAKSDKIICVGAPSSVVRALERLGLKPTKEFPPVSLREILKIWLKAIRIHQWVKNGLIFVPLILSHKYSDIDATLRVIFATASFSLCASSIYIQNDILDVENDRQHPAKYRRPFASGSLSILSGLIGKLILLSSAFVLAFFVNMDFMLAVITYYVIASLYSFRLKNLMLVDVFVLALFYVFRIFSGVMAAEVQLSVWLFSFSVFLFLSLAIVKRYTELKRLFGQNKRDQKLPGRGYISSDITVLRQLGTVSGLMSPLIFMLYSNDQMTVERYGAPILLWPAAFVILFWISYLWMQAERDKIDYDPIVFAFTDKWSVLTLSAFLFTMLFALFF